MTLFGSREGCWRYLDMAREPKLSHSRPGQKRQHGGGLYPSNYDLDYELYKEDFPYRVYEYQKIPPLISHIPVKTRRSHLSTGGKTNLGPHTSLRSNNSVAGRTKLRAEELHSIKGELSQIKAQVDSLLESLDRMDQRREHPTGSKEGKKKASASGEAPYPTGDPPRRKDSTAKDGRTTLQDVDSAEESTDTEEAARNHILDPESSQ